MAPTFIGHECDKCSSELESTGKEGENGYEIGRCVDCGHEQEIKI